MILGRNIHDNFRIVVQAATELALSSLSPNYTPRAGDLFHNTTTGHILRYNGTAWVELFTDGILTLGADGATQGKLDLWDGAGGNTPARVKLCSPNGTAYYLFVEDDGTLKIHTAEPTANTDGDVVGAQT